jgi:hypothetical protein
MRLKGRPPGRPSEPSPEQLVHLLLEQKLNPNSRVLHFPQSLVLRKLKQLHQQNRLLNPKSLRAGKSNSENVLDNGNAAE